MAVFKFRDIELEKHLEKRRIMTHEEKVEHDKQKPRIGNLHDGSLFAASIMYQDQPYFSIIGIFAFTSMIVHMLATGFIWAFRLLF